MKILFLFIVASFFVFSVSAKKLEPFESKSGSLSDFVTYISNETSSNIILGKDIDGTINFNVTNLDSSQLMPFFIQAMNANGYVVEKIIGVGYKVSVSTEKDIVSIPLITKIYKLKYITNTKAYSIFNSVLTGASNASNMIKADKKSQVLISNHVISSLPSSNSLIVSATLEQLNSLDEFYSKIDVPFKQVFFEVVILETDLDDLDEFGLNLSTLIPKNGVSFISNTMASAVSEYGLSNGGHLVFTQNYDFKGLLTALSKNANIKILSKPTLIVMDREFGKISVGQSVPFLVSNEVTDGGNSIQQIERKDVGVSLSIKPIVVGDNIIINIKQESSSVTNSTIASDLITNKRSISTVVKLGNNESVLLGGLVSEEDRITKTGVPLLKNIPLLGALFRSESVKKVQREMTVIIKATII